MISQQEAIRVLMLSPIYFKLTPDDRKQLIEEYCALFTQVSKQYENDNKKN